MIQRKKNFLRSKTLTVGSTSKLSDVPVIKPKCIKDCPSPLILMKCEPILEDIEEEDDELAEVKTSVESPSIKKTKSLKRNSILSALKHRKMSAL